MGFGFWIETISMPPAKWTFLEKATLTPTLDMSMDGQDYHHGQEQRPGPALQRGHQSGPRIVIILPPLTV